MLTLFRNGGPLQRRAHVGRFEQAHMAAAVCGVLLTELHLKPEDIVCFMVPTPQVCAMVMTGKVSAVHEKMIKGFQVEFARVVRTSYGINIECILEPRMAGYGFNVPGLGGKLPFTVVIGSPVLGQPLHEPLLEQELHITNRLVNFLLMVATNTYSIMSHSTKVYTKHLNDVDQIKLIILNHYLSIRYV